MAAFLAIILLLVFGNEVGFGSVPDTLFVEEYAFGSFENATRLCVGPQGWVYVIDEAKNAVTLFKDRTTDPVVVGGYGWTSTTFDRPTSISTDGLNVYVADYGNHRIQRFDRNLNFISSFLTRDTAVVAARFGYPAGAALSRLGDLFILDAENIRIVKFTSQSHFERSFGTIEDERGKLRQPVKIGIAPNDHIFVLEPDNLLEYDYFGNYLRTIGKGVLNAARGFDITSNGICVGTDSTLFWFSLSGDLTTVTPLTFILTGSPILPLHDVAVTKDRLYILSASKVSVFKITETEE